MPPIAVASIDVAATVTVHNAVCASEFDYQATCMCLGAYVCV